MQGAPTLEVMRALFVVLAAVFLTLGSIAPVQAQRDPFEPLVGEGSGAAEQEQPAAEEPAPEIQPQTGPTVANTGADSTPWLALAYALIAIGVGLVLLARLTRPLTE